MIDVLSLVVPLFGLILLGVVAGRSSVLAAHGRRIVDWLLFSFALPALLFHIVATSSSSDLQNLAFFFTVAFGTYCAFAVAFTIAAMRNRGDIQAATLLGALGSHGAIAHIGPALVLPAFGPAAGLPMALIFLFDGILIRLLLPVLWAIGGKNRSSPTEVLKGGALSVVRQPAIVAVALGAVFALLGVDLPAGLGQGLDILGAAAAPLGLIGMGLALANYRSSSDPGGRMEWSSALATKLFIHPAIVYLLLGWIGDFDPAWMFTALFLSALPPAWGIGAMIGNARPGDRSDAVAATGMIVSLLTITALVALTVAGVLPVDPFVSES